MDAEKFIEQVNLAIGVLEYRKERSGGDREFASILKDKLQLALDIDQSEDIPCKETLVVIGPNTKAWHFFEEIIKLEKKYKIFYASHIYDAAGLCDIKAVFIEGWTSRQDATFVEEYCKTRRFQIVTLEELL